MEHYIIFCISFVGLNVYLQSKKTQYDYKHKFRYVILPSTDCMNEYTKSFNLQSKIIS